MHAAIDMRLVCHSSYRIFLIVMFGMGDVRLHYALPFQRKLPFQEITCFGSFCGDAHTAEFRDAQVSDSAP
jgi:hypothetical protein